MSRTDHIKMVNSVNHFAPIMLSQYHWINALLLTY